MDVNLSNQAATLTALVRNKARGELSSPRVIAVASGKGGVGKTSLVANLAIAFARMGQRVLAIDGDLGLANLDLTLGVTPTRTLLDLFSGAALIGDVLAPGPETIQVLAACSGQFDLANLADRERYNLFAAIDTLEDQFDTLLIDTAAGIGSNAISFATAAESVIIVATLEPTSLADAYAFIKVLHTRGHTTRVHLVANMVHSVREGEVVYERICQLAERFLGVSIHYLGAVLHDPAVSRSIHAGSPLLVSEPNSAASQAIGRLAARLVDLPDPTPDHGGVRLFWRRLINWRAAS